MTSVLKKSRGAKGKSVSMQEDLPSRWEGSQRCKSEEVADLIKFIDESIVGKGNSFCGPYGRRKVVYCDYSGSGRALHWLEEHVLRDVLPAHGTQCTALAHASAQQQLYREESRTVIRSSVCAGADDVVVLGASLPRILRALKLVRPTVFVSSRETERQLTPWKECQAEIIRIPESKEGFLDLDNLEQRLQENSGNGRRMIGFFAAASKLTGVLADDVATTLLLHQYGALAFWDYTLVAPYNGVDMNPTFPGVDEKMVRKDLVLFNCEKFVGGVQGPHIAVVKKDVFKETYIYTDDVEALSERLEEWRCVEAVRAALVMRLRDAVGVQTIADRQDYITRQVLAHIKNIPELILLGSESFTARRLPIFSLMVKHPRGTFLHHNFVCAVLNDVFGIQARGGLSSDLAYGEDVLGIDNNLLREYEKLLDVEAQKEIARFRKISDAKAPEIPIHNEHLRPGFCRVSLPYFMSESELAFVLEALKMVATEGWKILPQYLVNPETGQWSHYSNSILRDRKSLYSVRYHGGKMTADDRRYSGPGIFPQTYTECLQTARNLFNRARKLAMKCAAAEPEMGFNPRIDYLRWFMLPKEAHDLLLGKSANVKHIVPFDPSGYTGARKSLISSRSNITSSPIFGSSPRHFSLSALDDCQILRLKQKPIFYSRESSLKESQKENTVIAEKRKPSPVQFALGESVSPIQLKPQSSVPQTILVRSRCYSLGSDSPPPELSSETKMNLGLKESSPNVTSENAVGFCHCGSQTDLQSLDDPMILPSKSFPYSAQNSISDCSQFGRSSPTISVASHNSEDLHAYVKEMTKELATEIKSEIREVISQVDDILENSDAVEQNNLSLNSISSHSDKNSVSVIDVAEYLMGMSKEMASEVKHEIREMVNQVDEMISPDYGSNSSRRSSPPQSARRRVGSGPDLGLDLKKASQCLKKCPTSPVLPTEYTKDEEQFCKRSPLSSVQSPKSVSRTPPQETSGPNSISFSSETSTPDTIIQAVTANQNSPNLPKSLSSNKLSDEDIHCSDVTCRHYCMKKNWCQNPSVSSQDSGINMTFTDTDAYLDFGKWRTSSDPTTKKSKELQGRLRMCQRHEKSEVPDIIEGVPVCASQPVERRNCRQVQTDLQGNSATADAKRSSRSSNASSSCSDRSSRSSGYGTDVQRLPVQDEHDSDAETECKCPKTWCEVDASMPVCAVEEGDSSACSDTSLSEFTCDEAPWHCPPKRIWKPALEALSEYNMVRPGDKVLICLSGCRESVALLHTLHHYQFYSRSKGIHFSIGALYVHEPHSDVDPLHLMAYCRTLGVKLVYQDKIEDTELDRRNATKPCEAHRWATHAVRRRAYIAASSHGYHVVAVAQHLDDAARAFLANVFHCGALRTMKAHYCVKEHDLRIIRPLIYVRESDIERWTYARRLPDFHADCAVPEGRARVAHGDSDESSADDNKDTTGAVRSAAEPVAPVAGARELLVRHEHQHPGLFTSLKRALHPLISSRNIEKDLKERHRKKSVIQMRNGAPVYDSEEGTDEEPVP